MKSISILGNAMTLLPCGSVLSEADRILFVSDLHLGKAETFRRHSVPIPEGADERTLHRLTEAMRATRPTKVVILGDLIHAKCPDHSAVLFQLAHFLQSHDVGFNLVIGNHDIKATKQLGELPLALMTPPIELGPFILTHDPLAPLPFSLGATQVVLGGHWHPSVRIGSATSDRVKLRCFWISGSRFILPAYGEFIGGMVVKPEPNDRIYMLTEDEIVEGVIAPK
jgi:uncharacterized protein